MAKADPHHGEGPWYHGTPEELPAGTALRPGAEIGKQNMGSGSDSSRLWVSNDPWRASSYGIHIYEVDPHDRPRAPHAGSDEHAVSGATVIREVPYQEATAASKAYQEGAQAYARQQGIQAQAAHADDEYDQETPAAERTESVRHILDHYQPYDFPTWKEVSDNNVWDHPSVRALVDDIRQHGVRRPIPVDYEQDPPQVRNGHTRLLAAYRAGVAHVPTRQYIHYADPDDDSMPWDIEHARRLKEAARSRDEPSGDHEDAQPGEELLGYFEASGVDDYGMGHRPLHDGAPAHDLHEGYAEDIYTHPQYWAANWPDKASAEGLAQLRKARGNPEHPVTIYRASPPGSPYKMHTGDWVSLSPSYAQQHAYNEGDDEWHVHKAVVPAKHVRDAGTDQYREQGYWGPDIDTEHHSGPMQKEAAVHQGASSEDYGILHRPDVTGPPLHDLTESGGDWGMPKDIYERMHEYNLYSHDNGLLGEAAYKAMGKIRKFRGQPEKKVRIWRSAPAVNPESRNGKRGEINHGDWVGLSREKALSESYEVNDPSRGSLPANHPQRYHIWSALVPARHVRNADGDLTEWGYAGPDIKDIPHISEQCSHRARVQPREAALDVVAHFEETAVQHHGISGESAPESRDIFAAPTGISPVDSHHSDLMHHPEKSVRTNGQGEREWVHPHLSAPDHGPYYVARDPEDPDNNEGTLHVLDRHGQSTHRAYKGGAWQHANAFRDWHRLTYRQDPEEAATERDVPSIIEDHERHLAANPPQFPHSRVNPQDAEILKRPDARVAAPEGHSPSEEYHGSYEVVKHPETGRFHVVDNQGRHAHVLPLNGFDTQLKAERSRDYTEKRQQGKERARGIVSQVWEGGHEALDPDGTDESRESERNMEISSDLMGRYEGGRGQVKFDSDEDGGRPYYDREHHLPSGQASGWYAKHYGGPQADVYHRATGDLSHAHLRFPVHPEDAGSMTPRLHPGFRDEHLAGELKAWHDNPESERESLESGDPRISRWKQRHTGAAQHEVVAHFEDPEPPPFAHEAAVEGLRALERKEASVVVLGATDWDQHYGKIPAEIHRGLYAPESHQVFSAPMSDEDIAHGLVAAHQEEQFPHDRNQSELFGTHWSASEDVARDFAQEHEKAHHDESEGHDHDEHSEAVPVVFHAQRPARHEIEDDPRRLGWQNVDDHDHPEQEVPIRHGAPVRLTGVSWLKHTSVGPIWHRHDFDEPVRLRAEDRDSPDDPDEWNDNEHGHLKEASVQHFAALANPHTGGHDWYHGSPHQFGEFGEGNNSTLEFEYDDEDQSHWNSLLGNHFAASHRMAEEFSKGEHGNDMGHGEEGPAQNVLHARLELKNPKAYASEHDMDQEAYEHEWKAGNHHEEHHEPGRLAEAREEGWEDELPRTYKYAGHGDRMRPQSEGDAEYARMGHYHPYATGWLNAHPDKYGIAMRHRQRLIDAGHDGIVYGNEFEKHHGTADSHHVCAIPFHAGQVDVTQRHTGEHCVDPHSASRQWPGRSQPMLPGFGHEGTIEVVAHFAEPKTAAREENRQNMADIGQSMLAYDKDLSPEDHAFISAAIDHIRRGAPPSEPIDAGDAEHMARGMRTRDRMEQAGWPLAPGQDKIRYPRGFTVQVGEHHRATLNPNTPSGWHVRTHPADYGSAAGHIHHDLDVADEDLPTELHKYYASPQIKGELAAQRAEMITEDAADGGHTAAAVVAHFMDGEDHEPIPEWGGGKLFHGTRSILHPGEALSADEAVRHKAHPSEVSEGYVHATPVGSEAQYWAEHADPYTTHSRMTELGRGRTFSRDRGENQGHAYPPRVYEVEPTGHVEPDPNGEGSSYRSAHPMRVLREVRPLSCYAEEHENEEHWPDHPHYEFLRQEQEEDDDDGRREAALTEGPAQLSPAEERSDRWHEFGNRYNDDLHRGIHVRLPEDVHQAVHDEASPREARAAALAAHFARNGLGMHWTPHLHIAQRAIANAAARDDSAYGHYALDHGFPDQPEEPDTYQGYLEDDDDARESEGGHRNTDVIFHAKRPGERNRLRNPQDLEEAGIGRSPDEHEFPLKPGTPLRLSGISWRQHEPQYPMQAFEHHDFAKPARHVSSRRAEMSRSVDSAAIQATAHTGVPGHFDFYHGEGSEDGKPRTQALEEHLYGNSHGRPSWDTTMDEAIPRAQEQAYAGDGTNTQKRGRYHDRLEMLHGFEHEDAIARAHQSVEGGADPFYPHARRAELERGHHEQWHEEQDEHAEHQREVTEHLENGQAHMHGQDVSFGEMAHHLRSVHGIPHDALPEHQLPTSSYHDPYQRELEEMHEQHHGENTLPETGSYRHTPHGQYVTMHWGPRNDFDAEHHLVEHHGFDIDELRHNEPDLEAEHQRDHASNRSSLDHHAYTVMDPEGHLPGHHAYQGPDSGELREGDPEHHFEVHSHDDDGEQHAGIYHAEDEDHAREMHEDAHPYDEVHHVSRAPVIPPRREYTVPAGSPDWSGNASWEPAMGFHQPPNEHGVDSDTAHAWQPSGYVAPARSKPELIGHMAEHHGVTYSGDKEPGNQFLISLHNKFHDGELPDRGTPHQHDYPEGHDPVFGSKQARELVAHFGERAPAVLDHAHDTVLAPAGPFAPVLAAVAELGSWDPQDKAEVYALVRDFGQVFTALREGVLRAARIIEELPLDPDVADGIHDVARGLLTAVEDHARIARMLPPEAAWEEPGRPNR